MKRQLSNNLFLSVAIPLLMATAFSGCGSQNYQSVATTSQSQAPGSFAVAPKVDIIVVEDDTGSMFEPYETISSELTAFANSLSSQNWNYHFAVIPLTTDTPFTQAVASTQDVNWGSYWTAPYPGATLAESQAESLPASLFSILPGTSYTGLNFPYFDSFVQQDDINNSLNGAEPGFINLETEFANRIAGAGFLRPDAMTVVIFVGNGNDTSYVNFCRRADNIMVPCEQVAVPVCTTTTPPFTLANGSTTCQSAELSMNYFTNLIGQNSLSLRVYSADAMNTGYGSCAGGNATQGARYQQMASNFGGLSYDVCSTPLTNILSGIQNDLSSLVLDYVTSYVMVNATVAPNPATIQVQKYPGGIAADAITIPEDPTNGWSYIGYQTEDLISSPVAFDPQTGYMIQLNGTAQLHGQDTAFITYNTANGVAETSSSQ